MPEEEVVELKFRLYDGSDIGPFRYSPASTVAMLKERIITEWPKVQVDDDLLFPIETIVILVGKALASTKHERHISMGSCSYADAMGLGKDKKIVPKTANDIKLINAGKFLENNKTVGQCRVPFGELSKGVITMHVVVQPSLAKAKTEKKVDEAPRQNFCSCSIL